MDYIQIISIAFQVIGVATVLFRIIAPLTETKKDDKILSFLTSFLSSVALNKEQKVITVKVK